METRAVCVPNLEVRRELDAMRLDHARERMRRRQLEGEVQELLLFRQEASAPTKATPPQNNSHNAQGWAVRAVHGLPGSDLSSSDYFGEI